MLAARRARRRGREAALEPLRLAALLFITVAVPPGAVIGGRLLHGLDYLDVYALEPAALLDPAPGSLSPGRAGLCGGARRAPHPRGGTPAPPHARGRQGRPVPRWRRAGPALGRRVGGCLPRTRAVEERRPRRAGLSRAAVGGGLGAPGHPATGRRFGRHPRAPAARALPPGRGVGVTPGGARRRGPTRPPALRAALPVRAGLVAGGTLRGRLQLA